MKEVGLSEEVMASDSDSELRGKWEGMVCGRKREERFGRFGGRLLWLAEGRKEVKRF